ncbi:MAG TPA: hypothetical protein VMW53_13065 [archaeon]|nr:hypothetical protein [archaeon]
MSEIYQNINSVGLIDLSSENAPDYLSGNVRRIQAEKARQERKMKQMEGEVKFFEDLTNNVLIPNGLVTDKEKNCIFLKDNASQSKEFWCTWLDNYNRLKNLNGSALLNSYKENEFIENPIILLKGKMGSMPENLFDIAFYLDKLARFAADLQTEWKTPHFSTKKNKAGANILVEEIDSERNLEAMQIVKNIWDIMDDFNKTNQKNLDYYNAVNKHLSDNDEKQMLEILKDVFENPRIAKEFEIERFELLKKYSKILFLVKENWEKRLNRKYDGFTDFNDVECTINIILNNRLELIDSIFEE